MNSQGAVFLSYASQDTEPARRIAEGLHQAGLEVWFDQSELRGGDAWDALIRRRVKDCALFIPIISANTEARSEGYFRLEWKLAVDRSHLLADDRTFLMPVVVDDTREAVARVPEGFHARQWTRLANGETTPQFIAHVQRVLGEASREALATACAPAPAPKYSVDPPPPRTAPAAPPGRLRMLGARLQSFKGAVVAIAGVGAVLSGLVGYWTTYKTVKVGVAPPTVAAAPRTGPADAAPEKSAGVERPAPVATAVRPERREPAPERGAGTERAQAMTAAPERREAAPRVAPQKIDLLQPAVLHASDVPQIQILPAASMASPQELAGWNARMELSFWETIKGSTMVEDYEEYLKQYPDGRFAGLARNRVKAIRAPKR